LEFVFCKHCLVRFGKMNERFFYLTLDYSVWCCGDDVNTRLHLDEVMFRPSLGLWQSFLWTYLARNVILQCLVLLGIR
jgi:hypothetical protein